MSSARRERLATRVAAAIALTFLIGVPSAYFAASEVNYVAEATLSIDPGARPEGAARNAGPDAWVQLLRTYVVLDSVVVAQRLWASEGHSGDPDKGGVRRASAALSERLETVVDGDGLLLRLKLTGPDAEATWRTLDALMERYVDVAHELKQRGFAERLATLEEQLRIAEAEVTRARGALREFEAANPDLSFDPATYRVEASNTRLSEAGNRLAARAFFSWTDSEVLRGHVKDARLAAAGVTPDVRILEPATITGRMRLGR